MRKPLLSDFGLTEQILEKHKANEKEVADREEHYLRWAKATRGKILIISLVVTFVVFIIAGVLEFNTFGCVMLSLSLFWDGVFGFYTYQTSDDTVIDISWSKRQELRYMVINRNVENAVADYNKALADYKKATSINQYSLVRVELLLPPISGDRMSIGEQWMVFSNVYLSNPRSYPDIALSNLKNPSFEAYYYDLLDKQKKTPPKPKKALNIEGDFRFYYPFSDMFLALKGKNEGDIVDLSVGTSYKILEVINMEG